MSLGAKRFAAEGRQLCFSWGETESVSMSCASGLIEASYNRNAKMPPWPCALTQSAP